MNSLQNYKMYREYSYQIKYVQIYHYTTYVHCTMYIFVRQSSLKALCPEIYSGGDDSETTN